MGFDPRFDPLAEVPTRIVPHHQQGGLAFGGEARQHPGQKRFGALADRTPVDKAQQHLSGIGTKQSVAREGFGVWIGLVGFVLH